MRIFATIRHLESLAWLLGKAPVEQRVDGPGLNQAMKHSTRLFGLQTGFSRSTIRARILESRTRSLFSLATVPYLVSQNRSLFSGPSDSLTPTLLHHVIACDSLRVVSLRWMPLLVCPLYSIMQLLVITSTSSVCDGPPC